MERFEVVVVVVVVVEEEGEGMERWVSVSNLLGLGLKRWIGIVVAGIDAFTIAAGSKKSLFRNVYVGRELELNRWRTSD